jgi:hypothetical protein
MKGGSVRDVCLRTVLCLCCCVNHILINSGLEAVSSDANFSFTS